MQSLILIRRRGWSGRIASLPLFGMSFFLPSFLYPRRARSALGVDTVLTLDVCMYVCMFECMYVCMHVSALERKRLIGMT